MPSQLRDQETDITSTEGRSDKTYSKEHAWLGLNVGYADVTMQLR